MAGPNQTPGPTAIRAPTLDLNNHQTVLTQLKETTETAQRLRGNPLQSYVTLGELINAGIIKFLGGVVSPGPKIGGGGGGGSVNVLDSITGDGSSGTPLKLVGDSASPGNTMLYGTNGSGSKGWYAQPGGGGGGSLTVTDGGHTVTGTTNLLFSGATVSGSTPNATVTISGTSTPAYPGTLSDLVFWFESDNILAAAGKIQPFLFDRTPWSPSLRATNNASTVAISATQLNSLNVLLWPAPGIGSTYTLTPGVSMTGGGTYFIIVNPNSPSSTQSVIGGPSAHAMALYGGVGTNALALVDTFTAVIGTCSTTWTAGTWFQANVTYDAATGNWAFRQGRAAANSGTYGGTTTIVGSTPSTQIGADDGTANLNAWTIAAIIMYNRVLSPTEVTNVENYLFAKWGV